MSRVAIYARVSTPNQAQTQTIEQQIQRLQAHVERNGWQLKAEHIFRDDGRSGATLNRLGLDSLRDAVRMSEVDRALITSPDRLARNYVHQMVLLDELERHGCCVSTIGRNCPVGFRQRAHPVFGQTAHFDSPSKLALTNPPL